MFKQKKSNNVLRLVYVILFFLYYNLVFCQDYKFRFINLKNNLPVEGLEVIPLFDIEDYISTPLKYNKKDKFYYYDNETYKIPQNAKKIILTIPSLNFCFPNSSIGDQRYRYQMDSCKGLICDIGILPTIKLTIIKKSNNDINIGFIVDRVCNEISKSIVVSDVILYQDASCNTVQSKSVFSFVMVNKKHILYYESCKPIVLKIEYLDKIKFGTESIINLPNEAKEIFLYLNNNSIKVKFK